MCQQQFCCMRNICNRPFLPHSLDLIAGGLDTVYALLVNFALHFSHCHIPTDILETLGNAQYGHLCFFLCSTSNNATLYLFLRPYLVPSLPTALICFIDLAAILSTSSNSMRIKGVFINISS